jgi:DNA-binding CsgD family transcriptional regulator
MTHANNPSLIGTDPAICNDRFMMAINAVTSAKSVSSLRRRLIKHLSIQSASYHHIPAVGTYNYGQLNRYFAYNFPEEIKSFYDKTSAKDDPGVQFVFSKARAMWLSETVDADMMKQIKQTRKIQATLDFLGDCLLVPLYGPSHRRGYFVVSFENPREFYDDIFQWQVQAILQAVHLRYCLVVETFRVSTRLTNRESEVLELITFGKTNPEIGVILGISSHTVSGYVKQIFIKLDTKDRVTAALRASSFNLSL